MSEVTNIHDLPTDETIMNTPIQSSPSSNNMNIKTTDSQQNNATGATSSNQNNFSLDQSTINQIVNGLQQANLAGVTRLPSRDIPMETNNITVDPEVVPNYVPPSTNEDYIKHYEEDDVIVENYNKKKQTNDALDNIYNEIQTPLLLSILYFLFQLPFFKKMLFNYIPFLFSNDGNYNLNGYLFTSVLFGTIFHMLMKSIFYFGTF